MHHNEVYVPNVCKSEESRTGSFSVWVNVLDVFVMLARL